LRGLQQAPEGRAVVATDRRRAASGSNTYRRLTRVKTVPHPESIKVSPWTHGTQLYASGEEPPTPARTMNNRVQTSGTIIDVAAIRLLLNRITPAGDFSNILLEQEDRIERTPGGFNRARSPVAAVAWQISRFYAGDENFAAYAHRPISSCEPDHAKCASGGTASITMSWLGSCSTSAALTANRPLLISCSSVSEGEDASLRSGSLSNLPERHGRVPVTRKLRGG